MRYLLMNKNNIVAVGEETEGAIEPSVQLIKRIGTLPLGFSSFATWIENRKASKHNQHLRILMNECGCNTLRGFVDVTHAASVNDSFWVKRENDPVTWEDVSLYDNNFNESISRFAFYGLGIADLELSSTTPELVTGGSFPKCLRKEPDGIYLYKRGHDHASNGGLEPYCEVMSSEIAAHICTQSVPYELVQMKDTKASRCRLFTNAAIGYVPMSTLMPNGQSVNELLRYMSKFPDDSEERFREMLVCDALTFNQDRHFGNFGVLIKNDTVQPWCMAPVFDFNLTLLPYVLDSEFANIGDKLLEYGPKLGTDFVRIGQQALTDQIRGSVKNLKDFEFSFRGDDKFSAKRVKVMTKIVNRQAAAILSHDVLQTKDVFIPYKAIEYQRIRETAEKHLNAAYPALSSLAERYGFLISVTQDQNTQEIFLEPENGIDPTLQIDFLTGKYLAEQNGKNIPVRMLPAPYSDFLNAVRPHLQIQTEHQKHITR